MERNSEQYQQMPLIPLNEIELFLQNFIKNHPEYEKKLILENDDEKQQYERLLRLMRFEWEKVYPGSDFFLEDTSYHLKENYFIPYDQNVSIIKNLRYMPLILHSHQFIEVNYVVKAGTSYYMDSGRSLKLQDGDIILSPPDFLHTFQTHGSDSIIIDIIIRVTTFDTAFFTLLAHNNSLSALFMNALYGSSNGYVLWHCKDDGILKDLVLSMYKEWTMPDAYSDKLLEIKVMEFFLSLMRHHEKKPSFPSRISITQTKNSGFF